MSVFLLLMIFVVCVLLQALFSGYESGFVSINAIRVRYLAEEEQLSRAQRLLRELQAPDRMLTMLLIGTNLMVVVGTLVVSLVVEGLPRHGRPACAPGAKHRFHADRRAHPARVRRDYPQERIPRTSHTVVPGLSALDRLFPDTARAVAVPVSFASTSLLRLFGGQDSHLSPLLSSLEEFRALVDEGADHGTIEPEEQEMIHSVIDMQSTTAKEIMVPRIAIRALPEFTTRAELLQPSPTRATRASPSIASPWTRSSASSTPIPS